MDFKSYLSLLRQSFEYYKKGSTKKENYIRNISFHLGEIYYIYPNTSYKKNNNKLFNAISELRNIFYLHRKDIPNNDIDLIIEYISEIENDPSNILLSHEFLHYLKKLNSRINYTEGKVG